MDLVKVVWLDAQDHADTWVDQADAEAFTDDECRVVSVGFKVKQTAKYLTIAGDWDDVDKDFGTVRKIPVGMIVSVDVLVPQTPCP